MTLIKKLSLIAMFGVMTTSIYANAQIKNAKTVTVAIEGTTDCKTRIENAGNQKRVSLLSWDAPSKTAQLTFNSKATTKEAILKRVALAGFDNDSYTAPVEAYSALAPACRYKGTLSQTNHAVHTTAAEPGKAVSGLAALYQAYFAINTALTQSDAKTVTQKAAELSGIVKAVKMETLSAAEHTAWMNVTDNLGKQTAALKAAAGIEKQRTAFATLSETLYQLMKTSGAPYKVYYNHCPMFNGGASWLSMEQGIKNPYYGSKMLTCGSTKETLQ